MNLMTEAYITGVGAYLPGDPAGNTELAARFGDGSPRGAARRRRALAANGIRTRHYAVNDKGMTVMLPRISDGGTVRRSPRRATI
jgi:3-oxoacyl-[acyl-carrier-protein] synthase-3